MCGKCLAVLSQTLPEYTVQDLATMQTLLDSPTPGAVATSLSSLTYLIESDVVEVGVVYKVVKKRFETLLAEHPSVRIALVHFLSIVGATKTKYGRRAKRARAKRAHLICDPRERLAKSRTSRSRNACPVDPSVCITDVESRAHLIPEHISFVSACLRAHASPTWRQASPPFNPGSHISFTRRLPCRPERVHHQRGVARASHLFALALSLLLHPSLAPIYSHSRSLRSQVLWQGLGRSARSAVGGSPGLS